MRLRGGKGTVKMAKAVVGHVSAANSRQRNNANTTGGDKSVTQAERIPGVGKVKGYRVSFSEEGKKGI